MVADDPELLGAEFILTHEKRWPIEVARSTTSLSRGYTLKYLVALLFSSLGRAPSSHAAQLACAAGDVACLVAGIEEANAGTVETLSLAAGT
jgi:hypothetical protein